MNLILYMYKYRHPRSPIETNRTNQSNKPIESNLESPPSTLFLPLLVDWIGRTRSMYGLVKKCGRRKTPVGPKSPILGSRPQSQRDLTEVLEIAIQRENNNSLRAVREK